MPNPGLAYKISELLSSAGPSSWPTAAAPGNDVTFFAALREVYDVVRNGTGGTEPGTNKSIIDAIGATGATALDVSGSLMYSTLAQPRCVAKTDGAVLSGTDDIFVVTGGPVRARIFGIVTTVLVGTGNGKLTYTTTTPAATVDLSAGAVAIDNDAAGTSYRHINTTAILTPVTAGVVMMGNAFATQDVEFFLPIGTMGFNCSGAATGVIAWYCEYTPLSPAARVAAAA